MCSINLVNWRKQLGTPEFISSWDQHLAFKGEWVRISAGGGADRVGQVIGLNPQGSLRLAGEDGEDFAVDAGDVHLRVVDNE